ncbi:MAG: hypothetical protein KatS3mg131_0828 [Candidatus Tectimicrobiota bacterium]|nr:MAG: hypothetical protein KatS3mg131_0828 [Candidatus Tectomicrobia bacterium]
MPLAQLFFADFTKVTQEMGGQGTVGIKAQRLHFEEQPWVVHAVLGKVCDTVTRQIPLQGNRPEAPRLRLRCQRSRVNLQVQRLQLG